MGTVPPPHHGVTVFNQNLLQSRLAQVFDVIHVDTSDHRNLDNFGRLDFWNVWHALKNIAQLKIVCLTRRPALVYLPNSQNNMGFFRDGLFVLVAKTLSKAKVIMHYHGSETFTTFRLSTNGFMRWFIPFVLRRVDVGIVLGEKLRRVLDGLVKEVAVVPNGSSFDPPVEQRNRAVGGVVTVAYLGSLMRAKGVIDLLQAARLVVSDHPNVRFRLAGEWWAQEPDTKEEALRLVAEQGLHGHIEFVGKVLGEEKERFLLESDMLVFPTWIDSFGMVNIEAMAAGCPVISTKGVGAIEEVVLQGETGILVEKQNPGQLAEAINRLVEDPGLRTMMGMAGRKRFEEHYRLEKNIERMIAVFQNAIES